MIEYIERFGADDDLLPLRDAEFSHQSGIKREGSGSFQVVASGITKCPRLTGSERRGVEPLIERAIADTLVPHHVSAVRADTAE